MILNNCTIIHLAQYAAPYEGNFIKSLKFLENELKEFNCSMIYVFPENVKNLLWYNNFSKKHVSYTTQNQVEKSHIEIYKIFKKHRPTIVHTHFEGYDIPAKKAITKLKRETNQPTNLVWHLHDYFSYVNNPIKKLYQKFCFYKHYGYYAKDVSIIGVCDEIKYFVKTFNWGRFHLETTIPNGIDFSRITKTKNWENTEYVKTFLVFGGRNIQKRIDIALKAFNLLNSKPSLKPTKLIIVNGNGTQECINEIFNGKTPEWCKIIEPKEDISQIFSQADCFISTSVHETFSYAVCEATIYGIPVIQSDIPGTKWNAFNPSTYVFKNLDINDLTNQIINVQNTPIQQISDNCKITRNNNMGKYSLENWANKVISFYKRL